MKKFIIYGAGERGLWCLDFLKWRKLEDCIAFLCDKRYAEIGNINGKKVVSYEQAKKENMPFLVSCGDSNIASEVLEMISNDGQKGYVFEELYKVLGEDQAVFLREWCAYHHAKNNDQWFDDAEKQDAVDVFWGGNTIFYQYFRELDLRNVIELACGRGRHVPHYIKQAKAITLVDILEENIMICRERFQNVDNITYYCNNGYNLEKLADNSYTALFTYDSMVHFEMMDVYAY